MVTKLIKNPKKGNIKGRCVVCGVLTDNGLKISVSDNFSGWGYFYAGECFCPHCAAFFSDQTFRKRSWIATKSEFMFMKKGEILPYLLFPPEPPFFIYITKGGQRQGWLSALKYLNFSREHFFVSVDWLDIPVWMNLDEVRKFDDVIKLLRQNKVSKTAITTGDFGMYLTEKAIREKWYWAIKFAKEQIKNPVWEVIAYVEQ